MQIDEKGEIKYALDTHIQTDRENGILKISQTKYVENLLKEFDMHESTPRDTPSLLTDITEKDTPKTKEEKEKAEKYPIRNVIGRLWWLVLISRPDLNCAVHKCAIWQNKPSEKLWKSLMTILRYLKHTKHFGIIFTRPKNSFDTTQNFLLKCFSDASFASEPGSKSRVGYFYFVLNCLVSWTSHHSTRVMSSSTEAECHALVHVGKENIWMREFLSKLNYFSEIFPLVIYQDNKSAITLSSGGTFHKRSKHFGIEFDMFREYVSLKEIFLFHKHTDDLPADMLTKSLPPVQR